MLDKVGRDSQLQSFHWIHNPQSYYFVTKYHQGIDVYIQLRIFEIFQMQRCDTASSKIIQIISFWNSEQQGNKSLY